MSRWAGVTVAEVARAAGVSTATVSNAINGTGRMAETTRARVRAVAAGLGYVPNGAARQLRTGRCGVVGLAVTTFGAWAWSFAEVAFYAEAVMAATSSAHARGYGLTVLPAAIAPAAWEAVSVDGVVLVDSPRDDPALAALRARGVPVAFDGRPPQPRPGDLWADNDHDAGIRGVLDHLAGCGADRVALVAGEATDHYTTAGVAAYLAWCAEHGRRPLVELMGLDDPHARRAADRVLDRLGAPGEGPDAIYGLYDPVGHAVAAAARARGLRMPEDLLLACASESPSYEAAGITTLSLNPRASTARAVELLIDAVEGRPIAEPLSPIPTRLTVRRSTAM